MNDIISEAVTSTTDIRLNKATEISNEIYRDYPAINQSFIKLVNEHGYNMAVKLAAEPNDPTDDMLIDSVFHAIMADDTSKYMRVPEMDRRTKEGKAQFESMLSLAHDSGKTMVQEHLWDKAESLTVAAKASEFTFLPGTGNRRRELSIIADAEVFRDNKLLFTIPIKGQIDMLQILEDNTVLVDYKTAPTSSFEAVRRKARDSEWPLQAFTYTMLAEGMMRDKVVGVLYLVSGKDTGATRAYTFNEESLAFGRTSLIRGLIRIHNQRNNPTMRDDVYFGVSTL
jgi:hypothetical protein